MNKTEEKKTLFNSDSSTAIDAINHAHFIAFSPYVWEATCLLKEKNILNIIEDADGITIEEIVAQVDISHYGVRILIEAGLGIGLIYRKDDQFHLTKAGFFFINSRSVETNFNFMKDVCNEGVGFLRESIKNSKPEGLKTLGSWNTIYEGLPYLPEKAKKSWFDFDHYYSDITFDRILPIVFEQQPKKILDIGGNTGRWALKCLNYNEDVQLGLADLGVQLNVAKQNIADSNFSDRAEFHEMNILYPENELPKGYDVMWMSQFLDCFSDDQILSILEKCHRAADDNTIIFINETFWDLQRFEASAFILQMVSFYFTTMANGNSQMYESKVFFKLIDQAGFRIVAQYDLDEESHTLLALKKK